MRGIIARNYLDVQICETNLIKEQQSLSLLKTKAWMAAQTNLPEALTEDNSFISEHLDDILPSFEVKHDKSSYTVSSDIPSQSTAGSHPSLNDDKLPTTSRLILIWRTFVWARQLPSKGTQKTIFWTSLEGKERVLRKSRTESSGHDIAISAGNGRGRKQGII